MPEYSSERGLLGVWQDQVWHFLKKCLKLLWQKGEDDVVAMPGPQEDIGMVMDIVQMVQFKFTSRHVLQHNISHCSWMMLFAKELIRDSENQSTEMKSRRGTIFLVFYRTWEEIIMLLVEKLLCNDLLGRYPYVSLEQ